MKKGIIISLSILGVTVIGLLVARSIHNDKVEKNANEIMYTAIDYVKCNNLSILQKHNENLIVAQQIQINYKVMSGKITESEGRAQLLTYENQLEKDIINKAAMAKLKMLEKW